MRGEDDSMQPEAGNSETEAASAPPFDNGTASTDTTLARMTEPRRRPSINVAKIEKVTPEMVRDFKPVVVNKRHPFGPGLHPPLKP